MNSLEADVVRDKRNIGRIEFKTPSLMVVYGTGETIYVNVEDVSPMGMGLTIKGRATDLINKDVVIVADTVVMYADVKHVTLRSDGTCLIGVCAKKLTDEILRYIIRNFGQDM